MIRSGRASLAQKTETPDRAAVHHHEGLYDELRLQFRWIMNIPGQRRRVLTLPRGELPQRQSASSSAASATRRMYPFSVRLKRSQMTRMPWC